MTLPDENRPLPSDVDPNPKRPQFREFHLDPFGNRFAGLALALVFVLLLTSTPSRTTSANVGGWLRSYIRLNLRSGAGTQFKILGGVETGDELRVLSRGEATDRLVDLIRENGQWVDEPGGASCCAIASWRIGFLPKSDSKCHSLWNRLNRVTDYLPSPRFFAIF